MESYRELRETDSRKSSMSCRWGLRSQISSLMK